MKLSKIIPAVVIVILLGLLIGAVVYIKSLKTEINQLNQAITTLNKSVIKVQKERDNYEAMLKDSSGAYHYNWSSHPWGRKNYEEMIREYEKALVDNPQDPPVYYNLGLIYDEHLDQPDKAIECYQKYLELIPADASDRKKVQMWIENCQKRLEEDSGDGLYR